MHGPKSIKSLRRIFVPVPTTKIHMGSKIHLRSFLTSELDEDEWSGSGSCLFAPEKTLALLTVFQTQETHNLY